MASSPDAAGLMTERRAYWCLHKSHDHPPRVFVGPDDPVPRCAAGHGLMRPQANVKHWTRKRPAKGA